MKLKKSWLINLILMLVVLGISAWFMQSRTGRPTREIKEKVWPVTIQKVSYTSARPETVLLGKVEALRTLDIRASSEADIIAWDIARGDTVKKGQLLAQLDPQDTQLMLQRKEADLDSIKASIQQQEQVHQSNRQALKHEKKLLKISEQEYQRFRQLRNVEQAPVSKLEATARTVAQQKLILNQRLLAIKQHLHRMAELDARYKSALAERDQAQLDLNRTTIKSPWDARIQTVYVTQHHRVSKGGMLLTLYDLDSLQLKVQIPLKNLTKLSQFDAIAASVHFSGQTHSLVMTGLASDIPTGQAAIDGFFRLSEKPVDYQFLPGQTVEVALQFPIEKDIIILDPKALYKKNRVYKLSDTDSAKLQAIDVEVVGELLSPRRQLLMRSADLKPGERVMTTHLPNAITGLKVTPITNAD